MNKFEKYLQETFGAHETKEIEELVFDNNWKEKNSFSEEEKKALEKYVNLIHLSLNNIGLKSLENLPHIKNLYCLSLNNNDLSGDDLDLIVKAYPHLDKLKISGNIIENMDNLLKLKPLKLRKIEVKENPFSVGNDKYKKKLFDMFPSLKIVDHTSRTGDEDETTDYHNEENENEADEDYGEEEEKEEKDGKEEEYEGEDEDNEDEDEDDEEK